MFYTKIRPLQGLQKYSKITRIYILRQFTLSICLSIRQFMDIFGAMLAIAAHWQIIVQNIAAQIWFDGSFLSTYLMSCYSMTSHQIVLQCSSNHLPNISPFGRIVIFSELTYGFDPRYFVPLMHLPLASASKHKTLPMPGNEVRDDKATGERHCRYRLLG